MQKNLVIVESPAKAKTIERFLGKDFHVMSSYGHIRDLKKKDLGINIEDGFTPVYEVPADKKKIVSELKAAAKKAEVVWLASDEDREGEAISWHLYNVLELDEEKTRRIVFHEITKSAILNAIENPRPIDINLVDAQQARRVLDRIVGFELSPVLWRKIKPALSAGRVQSVAVRLIVEREREIREFKSEAAYRIIALFTKEEDGHLYELRAEYNKRLKTKSEALDLLEKLKASTFNVNDVTTRPTKKTPAAPFTTSTLQQEASRKLGFSVGQTMMVAQRLYESGKITYMRTDSVSLSGLAINSAKKEIESSYGDNYVKIRRYSTKSKGAQEAHEAIRPTFMNAHTVSGSAQEKRLYDLIWKRAIASQMADAQLERTTVNVGASNAEGRFTATGEVLKFDGFLRVYIEGTDDENTENEVGLLPPIKEGEALLMQKTTATERFTLKPPRYTEATLVRKLEELGIGRPSTYAPTISTIQNREYVEKGNVEGVERLYNVLTLSDNKIKDADKKEIAGADKNRLIPTDTGIVVNDFLVEYFSSVLDYSFTANVEKGFDKIAEGKVEWKKSIEEFYNMFHPKVEETLNMKMDTRVGERVLGTDPKTGRQVSVKIGRYGPMVQIGEKDEEEKPLFSSVQKDQSIETITLPEALKLFDLPRTVGEYKDKEMIASVGRYGPYIRYDGKFYSLPKELDPYEVTKEESIVVIEEKIKKDKEKIIQTFEEEPGLIIQHGRYGPYISFEKKNYRIPKSQKPEELTLEDARKIISEGGSKTKRKSKSKAKPKAKSKAKTTKKTKAKTANTKAKSTAKKPKASSKKEKK
ncbi:MAG TPA: type I DNA topoisomerase [Dysgonamonadaceae bacterium]|nr:type I DNA topoisomerase [Dysgonamonadaceae bacterium]